MSLACWQGWLYKGKDHYSGGLQRVDEGKCEI